MSENILLMIMQDTFMTLLKVAGPILLISLGVGLLISIIQAVTQIQEQTLTFVPKIFAALLVLIVSAPWIIDVFTETTRELFDYIKVFIS